MINVTKTWMPDKKKYISYVDKIYENGWVTNNGPLVRELESRLAKYLGVKNIILVVYEPALEVDEFFHSKVIRDIDEFKKISDVIVANRLSDDVKDVEEKVYTRDIFGNDS